MASPWRLEAGAFEGRRTELGSRFSDVVPPCQLRDGEATPTWDVVLSAWLHQLSPPGLGDSPDSLVSAASDDEFGRFVLKTIELSRVLDQWRQYELAEA